MLLSIDASVLDALKTYNNISNEGGAEDTDNINDNMVNMVIGKTYTVKIRKVNQHESMNTDIYKNGLEKMQALNVPIVWSRTHRIL